MTWLRQWATDHGLQMALSRPGKPLENGIGEMRKQQIPRQVHWHNRAGRSFSAENQKYEHALLVEADALEMF